MGLPDQIHTQGGLYSTMGGVSHLLRARSPSQLHLDQNSDVLERPMAPIQLETVIHLPSVLMFNTCILLVLRRR